jgi:protein TonB
VTLASGAGIYYLREYLGTKVEPPKKVVQEVHIIRPPPPPPDVEPPPPPPEEEVDLPEPEPMPEAAQSDEPPPGEQLGVDAVGTGAGDGFGLVGRPGGRDLLASGGSAFSWYAGLLKNEILDRLGDDRKARSGSYSVVVRLWVRRDGTVEKSSLMGSTGDKDRDRAIEIALSQLTRVSQAPPADMPQPISLRIVSRA